MEEMMRVVWGLINFFMGLDQQVYTWVHQIQNPVLTYILLIITYLGFIWVIIGISAVVTVYLLRHRQIWYVIFLNLSLGLSWWLSDFLKLLFMRSRPLGEALTAAGGYSFPSGHAMVSMAFYSFLAAILIASRKSWGKKAGAALYILILLIGFSRVYLNVHYLSDVLAGLIFGWLCLELSWVGMKRFGRMQIS